MKAFLLVAHGSRRVESRAEIMALTERLAAALGTAFDIIDCAFLERSAPGILEQLEACGQRGATEIVVLPYLLASGAHVASDIPAVVEAYASGHPDVAVRVLQHIGQAEGMVALVSAQALT